MSKLHKDLFGDDYIDPAAKAQAAQDMFDPEITQEGIERRATQRKGTGKRDYSDKGEHDLYWISPFHKKCRKCEIIVDLTMPTPYYMPRVKTEQWEKPACTWKGRAAR